ncbi:Putative polyprenyl synthetase, isoprenoid synthase domain superfamily [Colletotrichum destructivum]|uniref:Polyprenyl synthetase, isoprenoid synthase domain superfamily n=1 Tax=Colletotrichum destructivum TaxID=34406 RepID=A0AAX4J2Z7_9PEZI|nr:Putative polyprenyl synthetase, isoprenoid synthase domain superfamily [Colletotrichum destructivum]
MLSEEELYPYSVPVDRETVVRSGALTTLPVRIYKHDDLADAGAICLTGDWGRIMRDGQDKKSNGSPCVVGNWGSFIWPESIPDRMGLLCYLLDVGCFHDDACEEMTIAAAHAEHLDLDAAMDVEDNRSLSNDSRSAKTKELVSMAILECVKVDRVGALRMLEAYRKKWLAIMETYNTEEIDNLDDYFFSRANNGGMGAYYAMLEFSLGIVVTDEEYEMMAAPIKHVERCMLLTNDYWSWPREREQAKTQEAGKVFNTVWFLMKQERCSEAEAKLKVADMVAAEEARWVEAKRKIYQEHPDLRADLVKFLENLHTALAGNDYWSSQCYRHNDWTHVPEQPSENHPKVHELAAMGRAVMPAECPGSGLSNAPKSEELGGAAAESDLDFEANAASLLSFLDKASPRDQQVEVEVGSSASASEANTQSTAELSATLRSNSVSSAGSASNSDETKARLSDTDIISAPIQYVQSLPSKGFRTTLIDCLNRWLEVPQHEMECIKKVINSMHDSSLILDDIEDGAKLRRGFPATHVVYGTSQAINSATFLYVQAVEAIHELENKEMMDVLLRHLKQLFCGQSLDLYWTFNRRCPTEDEYLDMIGQKTGALLSMVSDLMVAASPRYRKNSPGQQPLALTAFSRFSRLSGLYYQVRDDYMNIVSADYAGKKGYAEDLDEQKFSYMLVHMARLAPEMMDQVEGMFRAMRRGDADPLESKRYIVSLLHRSGSLEATRKLLLEWQRGINEEIERLEGDFGAPNPTLRLLMESLRIDV